jgi:hypothetical protein
MSGSLSTSGSLYYSDINHNLNDNYPIINIYDYDTKDIVVPKEIQSLNIDTTRVVFAESLSFVAKINI